jgi:hypothetical protein
MMLVFENERQSLDSQRIKFRRFQRKLRYAYRQDFKGL